MFKKKWFFQGKIIDSICKKYYKGEEQNFPTEPFDL